jgi:hypothetical protein
MPRVVTLFAGSQCPCQDSTEPGGLDDTGHEQSGCEGLCEGSQGPRGRKGPKGVWGEGKSLDAPAKFPQGCPSLP